MNILGKHGNLYNMGSIIIPLIAAVSYLHYSGYFHRKRVAFTLPLVSFTTILVLVFTSYPPEAMQTFQFLVKWCALASVFISGYIVFLTGSAVVVRRDAAFAAGEVVEGRFYRFLMDLQQTVGPVTRVDMIEAALAVVGITNTNTDPEDICTYCQQTFPLGTVARRLPCNHRYHWACIKVWLLAHDFCPICRQQVPGL